MNNLVENGKQPVGVTYHTYIPRQPVGVTYHTYIPRQPVGVTYHAKSLYAQRTKALLPNRFVYR